MARTYGKILSSLWVSSQKFRKLGDDDASRLLYCYLQTCAHGNNVGCYSLPVAYIMADLGWSERKVRQALDRLSAVCLIEVNEPEGIVFLVDAIEKDGPTNPSHAAAMFKTANALADTPQKLKALQSLQAQRQAENILGLGQAIERLSTACQQGARPILSYPIHTDPNRSSKSGAPNGAFPHDEVHVNPRGTRLAFDCIPAEWRAWCVEYCKDRDPDLEWEKFHAHFKSVSGKSGVKLDWRLTWVKWCRSKPPWDSPKATAPAPKTINFAAIKARIEASK